MNTRKGAIKPLNDMKTPPQYNQQGCLICVLKYSNYLGKFIGISPISWQCPHSSQNPNKSEFRISKIAYIISWLFSILLLGTVCFNVYDILNYDFKTQKLRVLYIFNDTIHITIAGLCTFISLVQIRQKIQECSGILKIIDEREMYGVRSMFDQRRARLIHIGVNICCVVAIFLALFQLLWDIGRSIKNKISLLMIFQLTMASIGVFITIVILLQFIASCYIYNALFQEMLQNLRYILNPYRKTTASHINVNERSKSSSLQHLTVSSSKLTNDESASDIKRHRSISVKSSGFIHRKDTLSIQLSKLRRLYASFIFNMKVLNDFYDPTKLILISFVLVSMVINVYLLIMTQIEDSLDGGMNIQSGIKLVGSLSATIFFFETADRIRISVQNISLFLYSFPISGLECQEAGEIEMYLEMLNTQRPILSASGVFNIGTGLLASISGTVVTYVLVALQFQIAWQ